MARVTPGYFRGYPYPYPFSTRTRTAGTGKPAGNPAGLCQMILFIYIYTISLLFISFRHVYNDIVNIVIYIYRLYE
jgi:hypothetical protein